MQRSRRNRVNRTLVTLGRNHVCARRARIGPLPRLFRLCSNRAQLFDRQQILFAAHRLLGADQVIDRNYTAAPAEGLDFHGSRTHPLKVADAENGAEDVNRPDFGLEIEILHGNTRVRVGQKGEPLRSQAVGWVEITKGFTQLRDISMAQDGTYIQVSSNQRRAVYKRSEAAHDDEVDVSVG